MSETSDMWDRFFRGSKYEDKWRKRNASPQQSDGGSRLEEISAWLKRLAVERQRDGDPYAEAKRTLVRLQDARRRAMR